jgi:hypothetical protein
MIPNSAAQINKPYSRKKWKIILVSAVKKNLETQGLFQVQCQTD